MKDIAPLGGQAREFGPSQPLDVSALVAQIAGAPSLGGHGPVIAIDGPSGSGKTTLAVRLADALGDTSVMKMDDIYPGWDGLDASVPLLLHEVIEPWCAGKPVRYRAYDWTTDRAAGHRDLPPAGRLIIEGVGSGATAIAPYLSLLIWLELPDAVRYERAIARDGEVYRTEWERWARQEQAMFARERTRERATIILHG